MFKSYFSVLCCLDLLLFLKLLSRFSFSLCSLLAIVNNIGEVMDIIQMLLGELLLFRCCVSEK